MKHKRFFFFFWMTRRARERADCNVVNVNVNAHSPALCLWGVHVFRLAVPRRRRGEPAVNVGGFPFNQIARAPDQPRGTVTRCQLTHARDGESMEQQNGTKKRNTSGNERDNDSTNTNAEADGRGKSDVRLAIF